MVLGVPNAGKVGFQELTWRGHRGSLWDLNFGFGHMEGSVRPDLASWVAMWEKGWVLGRQRRVKSGHFGGSKKWQNPKKRHFWHFWALLAKTRILTEKKGQKSRKIPLFSTGNSVSRPRARNALFGSPSRVSWGEKTPPGPPRNVHRVRKRGLQVPYLRGRQKSEKSRNFAQVSYPPNSPRSLYTLSDFNSGL